MFIIFSCSTLLCYFATIFHSFFFYLKSGNYAARAKLFSHVIFHFSCVNFRSFFFLSPLISTHLCILPVVVSLLYSHTFCFPVLAIKSLAGCWSPPATRHVVDHRDTDINTPTDTLTKTHVITFFFFHYVCCWKDKIYINFSNLALKHAIYSLDRSRELIFTKKNIYIYIKLKIFL